MQHIVLARVICSESGRISAAGILTVGSERRSAAKRVSVGPSGKHGLKRAGLRNSQGRHCHSMIAADPRAQHGFY